MRTVLATLAVLLTLPASAQVGTAPPPDEAGLYGEAGVSGGYSGSSGAIRLGHGAVGVRLSNGVALGLHAKSLGVGAAHEALAVGPEARLTRVLDPRTRLDLYASGSVGVYRGPRLDDQTFRATGVGTEIGASVTRRFDLGRGLTFAATGGAFAGVGQRFSFDDVDGGPEASAGLLVGAQLEFEVLGARVAVGPRGGIALFQTRSPLGFGADAHRAGGGPAGGFLTVRF